jgi:hypothetical protein
MDARMIASILCRVRQINPMSGEEWGIHLAMLSDPSLEVIAIWHHSGIWKGNQQCNNRCFKYRTRRRGSFMLRPSWPEIKFISTLRDLTSHKLLPWTIPIQWHPLQNAHSTKHLRAQVATLSLSMGVRRFTLNERHMTRCVGSNIQQTASQPVVDSQFTSPMDCYFITMCYSPVDLIIKILFLSHNLSGYSLRYER